MRVQVAAMEAGQVGDGSGKIELCGGLATPEVPGLAPTQLHQPGQAVLHRLAEVAIGCESGTALERAGGPAVRLPAGAD